MASMNGPNSQMNATGSSSSSSMANMSHQQQQLSGVSITVNPGATSNTTNSSGQPIGQHHQPTQAPNVILTRKCLQELVKQVDPNEQLDEDVEDLLLGYADEFFEQIVDGACAVASHRKASAVEVKDLQTYLERNSSIWIPGFGSEEPKAFKRAPQTEAHKQRMALIRKTLKKY